MLQLSASTLQEKLGFSSLLICEKINILISLALHKSDGDGTSLGRTIYVVIAIAAVILLSFITVMVYWKVQNSKESVDVSPANSDTPLAKCSSSQSYDHKENASIQSFVLNEVSSRKTIVYCTTRMLCFEPILIVLHFFLHLTSPLLPILHQTYELEKTKRK